MKMVGKNKKTNLSTFIQTLDLVIVRLMAGWHLAPDSHICASPHVRLFLIPALIRYDHSVISPPADNSFVLQIVNNILKSNNIIITGPPQPSHSLPCYWANKPYTGPAAAPGDAYVIKADFLSGASNY